MINYTKYSFMEHHLIISGFGIIGAETFYQIVNKNKSNRLKISIIDKNLINIPGGIAYGKVYSKFGFFNNPLRLSNIEFQNWVKKTKNQKKLILYFNKEKSLKLNDWLKKNVNDSKKFKDTNELYLPRISYSIYLNDKLNETFKILKNKKFIKVNFYQGEFISIKKTNNKFLCKFKSNLKSRNIYFNKSELLFKKENEIKKKILKSNSVVLGLGILPPSKIYSGDKFQNNNYIHDFYALGGIGNLINKIKKIKFNQRKIVIVFIGNKAGLLETMLQLENLENNIQKKLKILSISSNKTPIQKAVLSKKYKSYKFKYLTKKNIKNIDNSKRILSLIKYELNNGKISGYSKYDIWTNILRKNILDICYKKLNSNEKKKYNNIVFSKIRNITRYTYPDTVIAKERLEKREILKNLNDRVVKLKNRNNKINVKTVNSGTIIADIVINVSGPLSLFKDYNQIPYLKSLRKISVKFNNRGFISDKYNQISEKIYAPGTLSSNFNPERKTIIKSITENCKILASHLVKSMKKEWK